MFVTSIIGGRLVSRYGHYRPFLIAGIALEASALTSLAVLAFISAPPILFLITVGILGCGMGMFMPNLTNAVQNAVTHAELGAATGAMVFIRSLGGAVGVAASGAIMSGRLASDPASVSLRAVTQNGLGAFGHLSALQQSAIVNAYRTALAGSFTLSGIVMIAAFLLVVGLPEIQLRRQIPDAA
jgi:MFS family permease